MPNIKELKDGELELVSGGVKPKRSRSHQRGQSRKKANMKEHKYGLVFCPQCHGLRLPHRICPRCGYYDGKNVIPQE